MDIIALSFYAVICALLGLSAPAIPSAGLRILVGAGVGLVAASVLPLIKGALGV